MKRSDCSRADRWGKWGKLKAEEKLVTMEGTLNRLLKKVTYSIR